MESQPRGRLQYLLLTASTVTGISYLLSFNQSFLNWVMDRLRWCPTSEELLQKAEEKLFLYLKKPYELQFIPISFDEARIACNIRSVVVKGNCIQDPNDGRPHHNLPLVLLHGFASGIGLWVLNFDDLSEDRPIYALDILGFGRSSRPQFSKRAEAAEDELIESIEEWRKNVGLSSFVLLGHSMGGFLAAAYALKYPDRVKHLILADPWGFPTPDISEKRIKIPLWARAIAFMLRPFNPLAALRAFGPWGPQLIKKLRPDILQKFEEIVSDTNEVADYIYHCNAQRPSGEAAFKAMTGQFGWAKRPMIERIFKLRKDVSITFIYGSRSWIDSASGFLISNIRKDSSVDIKIIQGAGHHVYADRRNDFNTTVIDVCRNIEHLKPLYDCTSA